MSAAEFPSRSASAFPRSTYSTASKRAGVHRAWGRPLRTCGATRAHASARAHSPAHAPAASEAIPAVARELDLQ
eukprot:10505554-Alexandrium_andersonii.AAC.1